MHTVTKVVVKVVEHNGDFSDPDRVWKWFRQLVRKDLKGVHPVGDPDKSELKHVFPNGGLTGVIVLNESHVALHTWPEDNYAWFELATCGDAEDCDRFEAAIKSFK